MNIEVLKEFVSLAEKRNFRETAEELGISSSTVTKHITALENELGVSLFERTTRKVALNIYGQAFLPYAHQIIDADKNSRNILNMIQKQDNSKLAIGMSLLNFSLFGDALDEFQSMHPSCTVNFIQSAPSTLELMLKDRSCDLAFLRKNSIVPLMDKEIRYILYKQEVLAAYIPSAHPLAGRTHIHISDLKTENLIFFSPHSEVYEIALNLCNNMGFDPKIVATNNSRLNCQYMAHYNVGIALLPQRLPVNRALVPDVYVALIDPPSYINIYAAYIQSNLFLNSAALDFLKCLNIL